MALNMNKAVSNSSLFYFCFFLMLSLVTANNAFAGGIMVSPVKPAKPFIQTAFPQATSIGEKSGDPLAWTVMKDDEVLGYAFETDDVAKIPAYSGEPVNVLVAIDNAGKILIAGVMEHHEPILLVGIPEHKLFDFTAQYVGLTASDKVIIGGLEGDGAIHVDGLSGATVTVMVVNLAIMKAAKKVAKSKGIIDFDEAEARQAATVNREFYEQADWIGLTGDGSIRRLNLNNGDIEESFIGTEGELAVPLSTEESDESFIDMYYTQLNVPSIGRSLLGDAEYQWLMDSLQPGEHALGLMSNGFSFKGSGYVRGGIFDRIQIHQGDNVFSFRDLDQNRITDLFAAGTPYFKEMSVFIVRAQHEFDPGQEWQIELLVRRQTGPLDSLFSSFKTDYLPLEKYLTRPIEVVAEVDMSEWPLWQQVWHAKQLPVTILIISMVLILIVIFLQDWLVKYPRFLHNFRRLFLIYTVIFVGWYSMGQISIVNVLTFMQALMTDFHWETFLLDPVIFCLWIFVAVTILLWGRGIFCGWLCPFGALQELLGELAVKLKIPQYVVPFAIHERLWAVKYLILLALFGLSLESLQTAEVYAEVEPFKSVFLLRFDRDWPFIIYAVSLLVISLFSRKVYCRYVCPLGAAIAIPSGVRLFDWLKRRKDCGQPCQLCAVECEIGAIDPSGEINLRECHHCLDCQVTYMNDDKCPPLLAKKRKQQKRKKAPEVVAEPIRIINP